MARVYYPHLPLSWTLNGSLETVRWLNRAGLPVLVMHGTEDGVIPFELGQELFDSLQVPKELLVIQGAEHSEMAAVDADIFYGSILRFVERSKIPA